MRLQDYKYILIALGLIGVLLASSPALSLVVSLPPGEKFSELYILGPGHMAENYPYNVAVGQQNLVYVGVTNHMISTQYYVLFLKFGNHTDPLPNATLATPSPLPPLFEYRFAVQNNATLENQLAFSITDTTSNQNTSTINTIMINDLYFNVNKTAIIDNESPEIDFRLLIELWKYDPEKNLLEYDNRFIFLVLNLLST
jgi:hypothetical protein